MIIFIPFFVTKVSHLLPQKFERKYLSAKLKLSSLKGNAYLSPSLSRFKVDCIHTFIFYGSKSNKSYLLSFRVLLKSVLFLLLSSFMLIIDKAHYFIQTFRITQRFSAFNFLKWKIEVFKVMFLEKAIFSMYRNTIYNFFTLHLFCEDTNIGTIGKTES